MSEYYVLNIDSYAGRSQLAVEVVKVFAQKARVRLLEPGRLAGRNRWGVVGTVLLVPKTSLTRVLP